MRHRRQIVDRNLRRAWILMVAAQVQKRVEIVEEMGRRRRAEGEEVVLIEIFGLARLRVLFQIVRGRVGVEVHGEQAPPDQVRLARLAQSQRDVRLAHREVEVLVRQQELQLDLGVELDELAEPRGEPIRAEAQRRRDPQFAVRLLPAVDEPAAHGVELEDHVAHRRRAAFLPARSE